MSLTPGSRLGPYEVVAKIGAGGMGEVYRATDTKLHRDAALKVLPGGVTTDPERLARFTREAQVLASLNHPNIAGIYGFEDASGTPVLAMEFVEGDDLSQRISRGAIQLDEALPIARQIAEALEAAHEQGIVHRDLKPANIKVKADGTVKVLDFGLAKALDEGSGIGDQGSGGAANSPTITSPAMTMRGVILGTAAYMSPEQAKGKAVDKRSDIWAFGAVLFELIAGRRVFQGEGVSETLAAVIKDAPDLTLLPGTTPLRIRALIERCLERDVKRRLRDIGEARVVLSDPLEPAPAPATAARSPRSSVVPWVMTAALAVALMGAVGVPWRTSPREREVRLDLAVPDGGSDQFALAPDGERLVYVAAGRMWLRSFDSANARPIPGTEGASRPFWSPDGLYVGFSTLSTLKRVELVSGTVQTLATGLTTFSGGTWNAEGAILFGQNRAIYRISPDRGAPVEVTSLSEPGTAHRSPQFLPDGRHFFFLMTGAVNQRGLYLASLDDGRYSRVLEADTTAVPIPPDRIAFIRGGALLVQRFDVASRLAIGDPDVLANEVSYDSGVSSSFSASATGRIAYRGGVGRRRIQLRRVDRSGKSLNELGEPEGELNAPVISPDGKLVAFDREVGGNRDVWLSRLLGGSLTRLTFDPTVDGFPVWSPDGNSIAFESPRRGTYDLYVKPADGSAEERPVLEAAGRQWPLDWSKDGRFLLYFDGESNNGDLLALPMLGENRSPIPVVADASNERTGAFSPDGRWLAYDSDQSGRYEVVVQPFPTRSGRWQVSTAGGHLPRWSRDGRELFFLAPDGKLMAIPVRGGGAAFEAGTPSALFQTTINGTHLRAAYDVAPDGTFVVQDFIRPATNDPIVVVLNWQPKVK